MKTEIATELADAPLLSPTFSRLAIVWLACVVPLVGLMVARGWQWEAIHPAINAILNGSSTVFLLAGLRAIKRRDLPLHRVCMSAAVALSSLFLVSYLIRYGMSGSHRYPGDGIDKIVYLVILFSHMVLAAVLVPLAVRLLWFVRTGRFDRHKRIGRIVLPMWLYVSVTGVIVYVMLYQIAPRL